jgi:hypothetical protein
VTNITALIPIHRDKGNREWLQQAVNSLGPNVTPLILENDGEVAESLNHGLREATTDWVLPFGSDDVAAPGFADELYAASWDTDVAYPEMTLVDETLTELRGISRAQPFCKYRLLQNNYITGNSLIRRRPHSTWVATVTWEAGRTGTCSSGWPTTAPASSPSTPPACSTGRCPARGTAATATGTHSAKPSSGGDRTSDLAATFYFTHTPAVAYLRCQMPAKHLPALAIDGLDATVGDDDSFSMPNHRGAAIFQLAADKTRAFFTEQLQAAGHRVLVETDDNYLADSAKRYRKKANWGLSIGESPHTVQGHKWIVEHADGVIVTTDYLASQYRKLNPNVYVCPNQSRPRRLAAASEARRRCVAGRVVRLRVPCGR